MSATLRAYKVLRREGRALTSLVPSPARVRYEVGDWTLPPAEMIAFGYDFTLAFLKFPEAMAEMHKWRKTVSLCVYKCDAILYELPPPPRWPGVKIMALENKALLDAVPDMSRWSCEWPRGTTFLSHVRLIKEVANNRDETL